jgi:hypothetical protein
MAAGIVAVAAIVGVFQLDRPAKLSRQPQPPPAPASRPYAPAVAAVPEKGRVLAAADQPLDLAGAPVPVRSMLDVPARMSFGQSVWNENGVPAGPLWIRVDRDAQVISVFRGPHEIATAVILYGAPEKPTPPGRYPILEKLKEHRSSLYDADMPYTLRLTGDGIAIHASNVREGRATHGCIGVPEDFAKRLFAIARRGDAVFIV